MKKLIQIQNLSLDYHAANGKVNALQNITLDINEGEFVSLVGTSGCGKSSMLSILEGLRKPTEGRVLINNTPITGPGNDRGVVFQQYALFPWMTAKQNVIFSIKQAKKGLSKKQYTEIANEYLSNVGLSGFEDKYPLQLSGGMQQRVAIARALAMDTPILLMDEPFGAVDPHTRANLQQLLLKLWESSEKRKTVVFVTHDIEEAILLSDRIIAMEAVPGRIREEITINLPRPRVYEKIVNTKQYKEIRRRLLHYAEDETEENELEALIV